MQNAQKAPKMKIYAQKCTKNAQKALPKKCAP